MKHFKKRRIPTQNKSDSQQNPDNKKRDELARIKGLEGKLSQGELDRDGLNQLFRFYFVDLKNFFLVCCLDKRYNVPPYEIMDMFQEVLERIYVKVDEKTKIDSLEAYFKTATKNRLTDYLRKKISQQKNTKPNHGFDRARISYYDEDVYFMESLEQVLRPITNELERKIFFLRLEEYNYKQIQDELKCSQQKIGNTMYRIKKWLKANFKQIDEHLMRSYHP